MKKYMLYFIALLSLLVFSSCGANCKNVHTYSSAVTLEGNCTQVGVRTYRCIECGNLYQEGYLGQHQYTDTHVVSSDGTEEYILHQCFVCGDESRIPYYHDEEMPYYDLVYADFSGIEDSYEYTGNEIIPETVIVNQEGQELEENKDYIVTLENNTDIGKATLTVSGIGEYKNTFTKEFDIVKRCWEEVDGQLYYYDGDMVTGRYEIDGSEYFFNEEGVMQTGWHEEDGEYYCYDRLDGKLAKNTQVDGINVDETGKAEKSDYNTYKITTMMTAHRIMLEQTLPTDTMEEKRLKLFNWEMYNHGYHRWRLLSEIYDTSPDWEITFANDIFENGSGCCVADSSAVAFLFREIGYTDIYICHDTSHCWITVGGRLYDPLFAEAKSFEDNYDADFTDYRANYVGRRRVDGVGITD